MLKKFSDMRSKIWGDEAHACKITFEVSNGKFYAECESTMDRRLLTDSNCEEKLNDMFYDYCVENADWMGVSWSPTRGVDK